MTNNYTYDNAPIAIGAIGGSGTRVIARIMSEMNVFIGSAINKQLDNLFYTYFFKYRQLLKLGEDEMWMLLDLFVRANIGPATALSVKEKEIFNGILVNQLHSYPDSKLATTLHSHISSAFESDKPTPERWGWKEPNTHFIIPALMRYIPQTRYIHVVRNGLDMAYSKNQNQPRLWGADILGRPYDSSPSFSLSYWCAVHRRILHWKEIYPDNILIVQFESLCASPIAEIARILDFCRIPYEEETLENLSKLVSVPPTIGRHQSYRSDIFAPEDICFIQEKWSSMLN